ncbi:HlyC/CorC family transporter [Candidatus Sumerlaeota bacterium]|nr:HlyC/CorC family transporter [Candidatus Sumerlaeota bacterium]
MIDWPFFILILALLLVLRGALTALEAAVDLLSAAGELKALEKSGNEDERDSVAVYLAYRRSQTPVAPFLSSLLMVGVIFTIYALARRYAPLGESGWLHWRPVLIVALVSPLALTLTDVFPVRMGRADAHALLRSLARPMNWFAVAMYPALKLVEWSARGLAAPLGVERLRYHLTYSHEDLIEILEEEAAERAEEAPSDPEEATELSMIREIIDLHTTMAREVMIPLSMVAALRLPSSQEAVKALAQATGHTRFPVFRERVIDLIGYVDVLQILRDNNPSRPLEEYVQKALFVPETKRIDSLLQEFLDRHMRSAIVIDEYGSCTGWITREDILEEIVGEIEDEFDADAPQLEELGANRYRVPATMNLYDLEERVGLEFPHENIDTLGGFVYDQLGRVPEAGEELTHGNAVIRVTEMQRHKIIALELEIRPKPDSRED